MGAIHTPLKPYRFKLSLRLRHPKINHDAISKALGLIPRRSWTVGAPRMNPDGRQLEGVNECTYWSCRIENERSDDLVETLEASIRALEARKDFLREFSATGGEIEYFVGWFTTETSGGERLESELLARLADLHISLS